MLFRKFRQILYNKSNWNDNLNNFLISTRFSKKCGSIDGFWALYRGDIRGMSPLRFVLKDSRVLKLWSAWRRNYYYNIVVKRCWRDRGMRDVLQRFRHTLLRPRQTIFLSAVAYKSHNSDNPPSCEKDITDEELQQLLHELENVNELSKRTLFCARCGKRLVIDRKVPGVTYCSCKEPQVSGDNDGWEPFMEADDVIVWRRLQKPGQPFYAYKVYGRYKELRAQDFAAVQVDGAYRRSWDNAVASLSVVERQANGVDDQTVLHWEVLWPRLFANRDYVYIRRHKEFDIAQTTPKAQTSAPQKHSPPTSDHSSPNKDHSTPKFTLDPLRPDERSRAHRTHSSVSAHEKISPTKPHSTPTTEDNSPPSNVQSTADQTKQNVQPTVAQEHPHIHQTNAPGQDHTKTEHTLPTVHATPDVSQSVHSKAKKKSMENDLKELEKQSLPDNKAYVIASRSCDHSKVPHRKHTIRVMDFWSQMVIKSIDGADKPGMEFVLTYYEEAAVGGMPSGVSAWATGRAAPAFLDKQRRAASEYRAWRANRTHQDLPDYIAFSPETEASLDADAKAALREQDMESSKLGPDLESDLKTQEKGTQTDEQRSAAEAKDDVAINKEQIKSESEKPKSDAKVKSDTESKQSTDVLEKCDDDDKITSDQKSNLKDSQSPKSEKPKIDEKDTNRDKKDSKETNKSKTQDDANSKEAKQKTDAKKSGKFAQNGEKEKQNGDSSKEEKETESEEERIKNARWWRYLYPFYYFA